MKSLWRYMLVILVSVKFVSTQCKDGTCDCHCTCCGFCGYPRDSYCELCEAGWGGTTSNRCQRKNIAYKATAISSSTFGNNLAMNAVDEDPVTYALTETEAYPRLTIVLSNMFTITGVYSIIAEDLYTTFYVYITNSTLTALIDVTLCNYFYATSKKNSRNITCTTTLTGDRIVITTNSTYGRLVVYEIQVYECSQGTFGDQCDSECRNCVANRCDGYTGVCESGCIIGWQGATCETKCNTNCLDNKCDQNTGFCTVGCSSGWFGNTCNTPCPLQCKSRCDRYLGCTNCQIGYNGPNCDQCNGKTYGENCSLTCLTCDDCNYVNGCGECRNGFYGDLCELSCPNQCKNDKCDGKSGDCIDGCNGRYTGTKCETPCKDNCATCNANDLCISCLNGRFGTNCEYRCPETCGGNKTCDKNNGVCSECNTGSFGPNCTCLLCCEDAFAGKFFTKYRILHNKAQWE